MSETILTVLVAGGAAAVLALMAAGLLTVEASRRDLAQRVRHAVRPDAAAPLDPTPGARRLLLGPLQTLGQRLHRSALFSGAAAADLERATQGAGLNPRTAVPIAIAGKVLLLPLCPILAYAVTAAAGLEGPLRLLLVAMALVIGMLIPNWVMGLARRSHQAGLRRGLPDALDLLVVCTEAGLGLESAVDRVASEMRSSDPPIAIEFFALGQELRITSDRAAALTRFAERTQLESWQRLARTLAQTLRYGTPLGQALRTLALEMRDERVLRLEERAAKLPALMTLPMILFILPCLFIIVAGPAVIRVLNILN
ncbi:type II secretion system F family protein [Falsiroseomonas sp. E2-1-a4]|uniref:type II secretion system F family protein n=1 Tax=Falsiroseomonas sp. E2-1-a4 TaxID=3239299 RepID=UPI003F3624A6